MLLSPCPTHMQFKHVSVSDIAKTIDNLKNKTSCGWDNLSNKILKLIKDEICTPLQIITNQCFENGIFPDMLKIAKVIPLYKCNKNDLFQNNA